MTATSVLFCFFLTLVRKRTPDHMLMRTLNDKRRDHQAQGVLFYSLLRKPDETSDAREFCHRLNFDWFKNSGKERKSSASDSAEPSVCQLACTILPKVRYFRTKTRIFKVMFVSRPLVKGNEDSVHGVGKAGEEVIVTRMYSATTYTMSVQYFILTLHIKIDACVDSFKFVLG